MLKILQRLDRFRLPILLGAMTLVAALATFLMMSRGSLSYPAQYAKGGVVAGLFTVFAATIGLLAFYTRRFFVERRRLEELQRRNAALEEAIEGIATFDAQGHYNWVNTKFTNILGFEAHELIGLDIRASLVDADPVVVEAARIELRATGRTARDVQVRRKDGSIAHLHVVLVVRRRSGFVFLTDLTREKEAQAALRRGDERFRLAMLATRDLIFDVDWENLSDKPWVSDALQAEFGYPEGMQMTVQEWMEAIHPDDRERVLVSVNNVIADAPTECWTGEYRFSRYDGSYAYVFDRTYILRGADGLVRRTVSALTDMTARRRTEEELDRLSVQNRMILFSAADGLVGVDAQGLTTFVNPAAVQLLGWTPEELAGRRFHDAVHRDPNGAAIGWENSSIHQTLTDGISVTGTTSYWTIQGTCVKVELTSQPMRDASGEIVGAVVTFRDITQRLAVERMKDEFISVVSHELRTPLTSIRGSLGLISGGHAGEVPPKMTRLLEIAVSNTDRLVRLINEILDIERMSSGHVILVRSLCRADDLIRDALEAMRLLADQADVHLEHVPSQGALFGDRDRLLQTLTNLISNAIKFSPSGGTVTIAATTEGTGLRFTVADCGRGIPTKNLQTIFERFQQVDATDSRDKGGTGLGLAICRSIIHQHGGEIWAESEYGRGSRFLFVVPRAEDEPDRALQLLDIVVAPRDGMRDVA